ncbi:hypothetical protein D3C85_1364700 [compost metagenome]
MGDRVANAPVHVAVPDIAGMFFRGTNGAVQVRQHRLAKILFQVQIEGVQQIVFRSKIAKQRAFSDARISGDQRRRGGNP